MWMCYKAANYPVVTDLTSAVKRHICQLEDLIFDVQHASVYTPFALNDPEEYQRREETYTKGYEAAERFLNGLISLEELCAVYHQEDLTWLLYGLRKYLPQYLVEKFIPDVDQEEEEGEQASN